MLINWGILNNLRVTNDIMPINRLPPEILIHICSINAHRDHRPFTCEIWKTPVEATEIRSQLRDTLNASYVCNRWRSIIIASPELWSSFIDLDPEYEYVELARIILKRSKPYPITFIKPLSLLNAGLPVKYAHRIMAFHFTIDMTSSEWDSMMLNLAFPSLRFLCISRKDIPQFTLSTSFPGSSTPALEMLHLHGCSIQSHSQLSMLRATLTKLHVDDIPDTSRSTSKQWLDTLSQLPLLQNLVLLDAIASSEDPMDNSHLHGPIRLPLIELRLKSNSTTVCQMLSKLPVTSSCRILKISCGSLLDDQTAGLLSSHLTRAITNMAASTSTFDKCVFHFFHYQLECFSGNQPSGQHEDPSETRGWVHIRFHPIDNQCLSSVLYSFRPLYDRIEIMEPTNRREARYRREPFPLMELIPQLSNLKVIRSVYPDIMEALSSMIPSPQATESSNVASIFSALEELYFEDIKGVDFEQYNKYRNDVQLFCDYKNRSGYPLKIVENPPNSPPRRSKHAIFLVG